MTANSFAKHLQNEDAARRLEIVIEDLTQIQLRLEALLKSGDIQPDGRFSTFLENDCDCDCHVDTVLAVVASGVA